MRRRRPEDQRRRRAQQHRAQGTTKETLHETIASKNNRLKENNRLELPDFRGGPRLLRASLRQAAAFRKIAYHRSHAPPEEA
jgi:hypothetical protein